MTEIEKAVKDKAEEIMHTYRSTILLTINNEVVCLPYSVAKQIARLHISSLTDAVYENKGIDFWMSVRDEIYKI